MERGGRDAAPAEGVVRDGDRPGVAGLRDSTKSESSYSGYSSRFRGREDSSSPVQSHVQARIAGYSGTKPFVAQQNEYTFNVEKVLSFYSVAHVKLIDMQVSKYALKYMKKI